MNHNNEKCSVYIVEDEIAVRRSLIGKIKWDALDIYLMGQAQNAEEAHTAIQIARPDIILLDMRMPGMGGMKFLEILSRDFPAIKVIVLSGYSEFEYVKQALVCGASDYLLKPIIKEELETALRKVVQEFKSGVRKNRQEIEQHILLNQSIPLLKRSLLNTLLQGVYMEPSETLKKIEMVQINLKFNYYALVIINVIDYERVKLFYGKNTSLVFFAIENVMTESMEPAMPFIGFKSEFRENEYICIHGFDQAEEIRDNLERLYSKVIANIEAYIKLQIHVSVSQVYRAITDTHPCYVRTSYMWQDHYDHARSSISFHDDGHSGDSELLPHIWHSEKSEALLARIGENDKRGIIALVNELFTSVEELEGDTLANYRKLAALVYRMIEESVHRLQQTQQDHSLFTLPLYKEWRAGFDSREELKYGLIKLLDDLADLSNMKSMETKKVIHQAREYIDRHFYENLTLEFMAQRYHMNRTYFSELFKQESGGCSFKKYLIQVRIEKAKELLAGQEMKAANVALLVGFNDPIYFSTVFKKQTGLSIKEFKDNGL